MEVPFAGGPVAEVDDTGALVALSLCRPRPPDGVGQVCTDGDVQREHVHVAESGVARFVAHPVEDVLPGEPAGDERAVFPVLIEDCVLVGQRVRRPDLRPFLARQRGVGAEPTLPLETYHPLVELPRKAHIAVHRNQFLVREVWDEVRVDDLAIGVQRLRLVVVRPIEHVGCHVVSPHSVRTGKKVCLSLIH